MCWNSKVCSINCRKQRALKHQINCVFLCYLFTEDATHLANEPVGTWWIFLLHFLPLCRASLPRYHISPLCSILLLAQQRQVANFLPFNLQQFPCSRRTHTREEEPRLPWVNWARGLAKRHWWEVKVFWMSYFSSAKADGLNDRAGFASSFTSSHEKQGIKTESSLSAERNQRAEQWHTSRKSGCNSVFFHHFRHPVYLLQKVTKH